MRPGHHPGYRPAFRAGHRAAFRPASRLALSALTLAFVMPLVVGAANAAAAPGMNGTPPGGVISRNTTPTVVPPPPPPPPVVPITIAAVGDLCFDSAPKRLIQSSGGKAPFAYTAKLLNGADVTVGNLECPLSWRGSAVAGKAFTFRGDPRAVAGLTWAGFDFLSLANNHTRDYGDVALKDTLGFLDKAKLSHAGAGVNSAKAFAPTYITRKGMRIAYLAYCQIGPSNYVAGHYRSGTAYTLDLATVKRQIAAAKKNANYVIVGFHWGIERQYTPTSTQVKFGRTAIDSGANLVLAEHPHVIQGFEFYKKGAIAYSLGNFVFSPGSSNGHDSMILYATISPTGVSSVIAKPAYIGSYGRPALATGSNASRILNIIRSTSKGRGTKVSLTSSYAKLYK